MQLPLLQASQHDPSQCVQILQTSRSVPSMGVPSLSTLYSTKHSEPEAQQVPPQLHRPSAQQLPGPPPCELGVGGQLVTPQRPQDSQILSLSQSTIPGGQVQRLPSQTLLPGHGTSSHSIGRPPQRIPQNSCDVHCPFKQTPLGQTRVHVPQCRGSRIRSMHSRPHRVSPAGQLHWPCAVQVEPPSTARQ